jgi:gamma-glutamyltranspeptidase/glutathione hydrolase
MKGAIAAGHPLTAEAGAHVLAAGGNAADACVAAAFVSWIAESSLTGPGGGGFALVHRARERRTRLLDFFVAVPGAGARGRPIEMESVDVDFEGGESTQTFLVGASSCAVPGTAAGLEALHRSYGSLPWREVVAPAVQLARGGVELTRSQAYLHAILDAILRRTEAGREVYGRGAPLVEGDRLVQTDLAATLERIGERGARELYTGETGRAVAAHVRRGHGLLTRADLEDYRVIRRRPVSATFRGREFRSNPPPSSGGVLIAYGLGLLDRRWRGRPGSVDAMAALAETMRDQARARDGEFARDLYRGGLARRLLAGVGARDAVSQTTHISVVDGAGDAVSLSASLGSGSGEVVPGTGVHLNNMLGEHDLAGTTRVGARLTSMMAPSVVLEDGRTRLVVGSAGSARLRGAILQVVANVVGHGLPVQEAVEAPRVHLDDGSLHCEGGADPAAVDALEELGWDVVRWRQRNLYFGGAAAVETREDGSLAAAGDPRRGGAAVVVE